MKKINLLKILFLIVFWLCCTVFIVFYEGAITNFTSSVNGKNYNFFSILGIAICTCIVGASLLGSLEVLVLSKKMRKQPLGKSLIIKTSIYILFMLVFISIATIFSYSNDLNESVHSSTVLNHYIQFLFSAKIIMSLIYWGIACASALFILHVNEKFGQGVLISFLLGKYHSPKEENRIFMFMDLKSSTTFAEELGHIRYSRFIQDCFYDITDIITRFDAKIYQYVGDEVILSWKIRDGVKNCNCLNTFFEYVKKIKHRQEYYLNRYGIVPEFKAGLHLGKVTVAEVGEIKKELAFHGDVLNTAARIQGKCNEFKERVLISESMKIPMENQDRYRFNEIGNVTLKGKIRRLNLYSVTPFSSN